MDQADGLRASMRAGTPPLRVVGVVSGKGGVGKSNLSANMAVAAARAGQRVLVIDGDVGLANVEILYGITPRYHLGHLLDSALPLDEVLAVGPHGVKVLAGGSGLQALTRLDDAQKLRLVTALETMQQEFDLVLIDAGAGIGDNVLFFVGASQEALLVVSPEPTSLSDAYAAIKVLSQEAGVQQFGVVVSQAPSDAVARDIYHRLGAVTARFLTARLRYLGYLPRDLNVHRAVMAQQPLLDLFPHSPYSRAILAVTDVLLRDPPPAQLDGGLKFLWNRFFQDAQTPVE